MPDDIINEISQFALPKIEEGVDDLMVWAPSQSGVFTLRTAFDVVRTQVPRSFIFSRVWHPRIPWKISFFLLRLLRNRLPLDSTVCKFGIFGPSKFLLYQGKC